MTKVDLTKPDPVKAEIPKAETAKTHLHFVGIGGIGMSGIAQVFFNQGYRVSGSDIAESESTKKLQELGIEIHLGHQASHIAGAQVVVTSSAVKADNPEVTEAKKHRVPVIPRAEMLGELMRGKTGIAVAGTHGKTTTTSLLATILTHAGKDPTLVIGGRVDSLGGNAKLGRGQFVVAEADESDGSFLHLPATYAIVTNIDNDHMDHFKSMDALDAAFINLVAKLPFYGLAAVCGDDPGVRRCLPRFTKPYVTYGFGSNCEFTATDIQTEGSGSNFDWVIQIEESSRVLGRAKLNVPGRHNVLNALAAMAIAYKMGVPAEQILAGLKSFRGVARRFETKWKSADGKRLLVDDYGHHPTEIEATLLAAKTFWPGRVICVFQPHRYSRTALCLDGFKHAFHHADLVWVTEIYAAGEEPIEGVSGAALVESIQSTAQKDQKIEFVESLESAVKKIQSEFTDGDLVICMGAGSITRLPAMVMAEMKSISR